MKKTLRLLMLLALSVFAAGDYASAETTTWDFSDWYGVYPDNKLAENATKSGLTVYASQGKEVSFDNSGREVGGISCTHRLKFGGAGNESTGRYLTFSVAKNSTIKIVAEYAGSSEGAARPLKIALNSFSNVVSSTDLYYQNPQVITYNYLGTTDATIYLYSGYSGINLSKIIVEPNDVSSLLSWSKPSDYTMTMGNTYDNTAVVTGVDGLQIAFRSSDSNVAYIEANGNNAHVVANGTGTCTITAYSTNHGDFGLPSQETSFNLTITPGTVNMFFQPEEGFVNKGYTLTPYINFGGAIKDKITYIYAVSSNTSVATVPNDIIDSGNWDQTDEGGQVKVSKIHIPIQGVNEGIATITVNFRATGYEDATATFTIHVTAANHRNFDWADGNEDIYIYEGDWLEMPAISGNTNGNYSYSVGTNNSSTPHEYYYTITRANDGFNPSYWRKDWHKGEGVPDYKLVNAGSGADRIAYIFGVNGQNEKEYGSILMICANKQGDVILRAEDPQNSNLYITKTIHIQARSIMDNHFDGQVQTMKMPYTWDFKEGLDFEHLDSPYWKVSEDGKSAVLNYGSSFNDDYNDTDHDGSWRQQLYKYFVGPNGGGNVNLSGLQIKIGQKEYWHNKKDRVSLSKSNGLVITGDVQYLWIAAPEKHADTYMGGTRKPNVRFYVRGKSMKNTKGGQVDVSAYNTSNVQARLQRVIVQGETGGQKSPTSGDYNFTSDQDFLFYVDLNLNGADIDHLELDLGNCHIYWMGYSTEGKTISDINYATYSYPEDLDFIKTTETQQGVKTYAVSKVTSKSVTLSPLGKAKAGQGFVINGDAGDYYYIANARNLNPYSLGQGCFDENGTLVDNELIGTPGNGSDIAIEVTGGYDGKFDKSIPDTRVFHYILSNSGKHWNGDQILTGVGFYMANEVAETPFQSAYLPIDAQTIRGNAAGYFPLFETGDTDTIHEIETASNKNTGEFYNLNGVRVAQPTKGIYIHNGKKVVLK